MANLELERKYEASNPDALYKQAKILLPELGFEFIKKRPLGWFLLAENKNEKVQINMSFRFGNPTPAVISITSDSASEESMQQTADTIFDKLNS
ncbi:MAG: hypothetical protein JEZ06_11410 [Anaerolineaceae bacterium]|nr:hypothetical protein [Anaerolineaceae bacterium]